jgi:hypothetical protein
MASIGKGRDMDAVLRVLGTLTIIIAAIFLVVAGYSDRQVAPAMGLLGTIAGYLLGRRDVQHPAESTAEIPETSATGKSTTPP